MGSPDSERIEWNYRREAASMRAAAIRRTADGVCEQLQLLSQCETDHETVLRWMQELLEQLLLAQQLTLDFDCAARHEADAAD